MLLPVVYPTDDNLNLANFFPIPSLCKSISKNRRPHIANSNQIPVLERRDMKCVRIYCFQKVSAFHAGQ